MASIAFVAVLSLLSNLSCAIFLQGGHDSYARYPPWNGCPEASFSFDFKTTQESDAVLWYADDSGGTDFFYVSLRDGSVRFVVNVLSSMDYSIEKVLGRNLNDGRWHSVRYERQRDLSIFTVDHFTTSAIFVGSDLEFGTGSFSHVYVGGLPQECSLNLFSYSLPSVCLDGRLRGTVRNVIYNNCTCQSRRVQMVDGVAVRNTPSENCDIWNPCKLGCVCISEETSEPKCDCSRSTCGYRRRDVSDVRPESPESHSRGGARRFHFRSARKSEDQP